jgi:predicted metal-binding membrane protein
MTIDRFAQLVGEIHRPLTLTFVGLCFGVAMIIGVLRSESAADAAYLLTAAGLVVGGMYGFRSLENASVAKANAPPV